MTPAELRLAAEAGRVLPEAEAGKAPALRVRGMTVSYGEKPAIFSVDADFQQGAMTAIVGPNGAGKSTLLKAALGVVPRLTGEVSLFGEPLDAARGRLAYVPQRASVDWDFPARVIDVVMMGLYGDVGLLGRIAGTHRAKAKAALERVGMGEFAARQIGQLSGGQQQRVFLARALVQDADLYVLDEPFAGVDAATEAAIIDVLQGLKADGKSIVAVHHDLATVTRYFDNILMLNVRKMAEGPVATAFTADTLAATYGGKLAATQIERLALGGAG